MIDVMLNPDGATPLGLLVIVEASTGVVYHHQCGGLATHERAAEGYLVPVGSPRASQAISDWFRATFHGHGYHGVIDWTSERLADLRALVSGIAFWYRVGDEDLRATLRLDETRLAECVEAWIPVQMPLGRGILVLDNSD